MNSIRSDSGSTRRELSEIECAEVLARPIPTLSIAMLSFVKEADCGKRFTPASVRVPVGRAGWGSIPLESISNFVKTMCSRIRKPRCVEMVNSNTYDGRMKPTSSMI
jgi:hypothetical protein